MIQRIACRAMLPASQWSGPHAVTHPLVTGSESLPGGHRLVVLLAAGELPVWPCPSGASTRGPADNEVRSQSDIWAVPAGNLILPSMRHLCITISGLLPISHDADSIILRAAHFANALIMWTWTCAAYYTSRLKSQ
jgi:hypothetical protein